jgi:hypothetical protein
VADTKRELEQIRRDAERLNAPAPPKRVLGVPIPHAKPPALPRALPPDPEPTKPGGFTPAPGSIAPYRRIESPPPISRPPPSEEAPDQQSATSERLRVRMAIAERETAERQEIQAVQVVAAQAARPLDYKGIALVLTAVGGIVATVVAARGAPVPPGVLECPARLDELERKLKRTADTADNAETDIAEGKKAWRKTDDKAEEALGEVAKLRRAVPRLEGLPTKPN